MIAGMLCLWLALAAGAPAEVRGVVRSAGHRTPVAGAKVLAIAGDGAWSREAETDGRGGFVLVGLLGRDFTLKIVAPGHAGFEGATDAKFWGGKRARVIYIQPSEAGSYRTIVSGERSPRGDVLAVKLTPEEVRTLPGSQGDPLRALQNLPGVGRVPGGLGLLVLRGAAPSQSQVFVGEHPIPRAFHTPSIASVIQGGVLAEVKYVPSNFDARYGNAVGGIVAMTPRRGRSDGLHGQVKLDILSAGAIVEGPMLKRGSFLAAVQSGYLDVVLRAMRPVLGSSFLLPRFYDYQIVGDHPIGRGGSLTVRFLGAGDQLRYSKKSGRDDAFDLTSEFHRVDLTLRKRVENWDFLVAPAVRFDRNLGATGLGLNRRSDVVALLRAEVGVRPAPGFHLTVGADTQVDRFAAKQVRLGGAALSVLEEVASRGVMSNSGLYVTPTLEVKNLKIVPALRVSAFTGTSSQAYAVDPRLTMRWSPVSRLAFNLGAGVYSQPFLVYLQQAGSGLLQGAEGNAYAALPGGGGLVLPGVVRFLDARLDFDPAGRIGVSRAVQLSANMHVEVSPSLGIDATGFWIGQREGTPPEVDGRLLRASGGFAYGVELLVRKELTRRLYGWIAYTWMHAERGNLANWALIERRPSNFDQRHNFVALLGVKLPRRWEIGGRFRVVTGLPYSPVVGAVFTDSGLGPTQPLFGATNSARMPAFHQLDLRVDKTWVLRRSVVGGYLDVQNIYNRQNPEGLVFDEYFARGATVVGVPILPVVGVRVEY